VSIKATPSTQSDLVEGAPETFHPSAYVGRYGWVTADLGRIEHGLLRTLLVDAWRLTAPRRLAATYPSVDAGDTTPGTAAVEAS
jgi:hypothetical protein